MENSWETSPIVCLTIDIDWAPDIVIEHTLDLLSGSGLPATIFATHETKSLPRSGSEQFEIAVHPNFVQKQSPDDVLRELLDIFPDARGVRSHKLVQSTPLLDLFAECGLKYDSNLFLPKARMVRPIRHWNGLTRLPYIWADDVHCLYGDDWSISDLGLTEPGLRIFTFHPVHVFLNTEEWSRYESARPFYEDPEKLREHANDGRDRPGAKDFLVEVINGIRELNLETCTLAEITASATSSEGD